MTEDRLSQIALDMEEPLNRLEQLDELLIVMVDQCRTEGPSNIYAFFERNLGPDLEELRKLWREFFALAVQKEDQPPLKAVEE